MKQVNKFFENTLKGDKKYKAHRTENETETLREHTARTCN